MKHYFHVIQYVEHSASLKLLITLCNPTA